MRMIMGSKRMCAEARRNLRTMKVFSWGPEGTTSRSVRRLYTITFIDYIECHTCMHTLVV